MTIDMFPAPSTGVPRVAVPALACDTHSHIFGPFDLYPPLQTSSYPLPDAHPAAHKAMLATLGCDRGVVVQPAPYADNPAAILAAIADSAGALRGIAVAEADCDRDRLKSWADAGIVGLRFTEARTPTGARYPGSVGFDTLPILAPAMRDLGLHAQLWGPADAVVPALPDLLRHEVPLVLDHMAMIAPGTMDSDPTLSRLLSQLETGKVWIKLVVCRVERADLTGGQAVRELHQLLLETRPDRMLWGSDWPYVRLSPEPDAAAMLDLFVDWAGSDDLVRQVLVKNPAALYRFGDF